MNTPRRAGGALLKFTRIGFACKGIVYLLIGLLALRAAFRQGGETTSKEGAIEHVASQPFGEFALVVIGVGLLAYAAWRVLCGIMDIEHEGDRPSGLAKRLGYLASAFLYGSAGWYAFGLLTGNGQKGGGEAEWTARLLSVPAGTLLVILVGLGVLAAGIVQIRDGWKEKFREHLQGGAVRGESKEWVIRLGRWGYSARGIVFAVMGLFVISAAMERDPNQARGLEGALDALAQQPFGQWLLAFVAAGLACYGGYCFIEARYRRLSV